MIDPMGADFPQGAEKRVNGCEEGGLGAVGKLFIFITRVLTVRTAEH